MSVIIGSARIDENGHITDGKAGDQTKKEVSTQNFYFHSKGWYCLRAKDSSIRKKLAQAMKEACNNDNIGYNQAQRLQVYNAVVKYGSLGKISIKVNADCSELVRACLKYAGINTSDFSTWNEASVIEATGKFEPKFKVTSESQLLSGDILVTITRGHTVIVIKSNDNNNDKKKTSSTKTSKSKFPINSKVINHGAKGDEVKYIQQQLNKKGVIPKLAIDGIFGESTERNVKTFQKKHKLVADGEVGLKTKTYLYK